MSIIKTILYSLAAAVGPLAVAGAAGAFALQLPATSGFAAVAAADSGASASSSASAGHRKHQRRRVLASAALQPPRD